jgi:hypothetical protein
VSAASRYDALVATLVGVSALLVSAYTAYVQRQQVRAQVYPIIQYTNGWGEEDVHVHIANKGSGPALIRDVRVSLDGKPLHSWLELIERLGLRDHARLHKVGFSSFGRSTIAAGEQLQVLSFACQRPEPQPPKVDAAAPKEPASFEPSDPVCAKLAKALQQLTISVCYCSTLDDCSIFSDEPGRDSETKESRHCPSRTDDSFN